jgi:single-strand DNA-binding protein
MNQMFLYGNLTKDPKAKTLPGGSQVCEFDLATNHRYTDGKGQKKTETCFITVEVFGPQAAACAQYLKKGRAAIVEGRLKLSTWEKAGQKQSKHTCVARNVQFGSRSTKAQPVALQAVVSDEVPF